ncbi:MAG: hypothetical protein OER86_11665, partial [Phycisphaerae bacterium]|nr:hypothetical protein [Phycisphaerae bacterium]
IEALRLARGELGDILKAKPGWERATLLQETIDEQLRAVGAAPAPPTPRPPTPPTPPTPPVTPPPKPPNGNGSAATDGSAIKLLTREQVNLIKVYEIDLGARPRVVVPDDVIKEVLTGYRDDPLLKPYIGQRGRAKLKTLRPHEQLQLLFDLKARSLYGKVLVRDEPLNMRNFRTRYHPNYIVRYCGSCHTDGKAAGLDLVTKRPTLEATAYTNLLILRRTPGEPVPVIFKSDPERSLLLQYGLPQREATTPHPVVRGKMVWRSKFRGRRDPLYLDMVNWIRSLYGESEDYPIEFTVPAATGSSPPAGDPLGAKPASPPPPAASAGGT